MDEAMLTIAGVKHWLRRAVDQAGTVLDILVQSRRDKQAAKRLLRKFLKKRGRPPACHSQRHAGEPRRGQA